MTSGAIQHLCFPRRVRDQKQKGLTAYGVPTKVVRLIVLSDVCPDTPKSHSLTSPSSVRRTFAAKRTRTVTGGGGGADDYRKVPLMSRWIMLFACRYTRPLTISRAITAVYFSSKRPALICSADPERNGGQPPLPPHLYAYSPRTSCRTEPPPQ